MIIYFILNVGNHVALVMETIQFETATLCTNVPHVMSVGMQKCPAAPSTKMD